MSPSALRSRRFSHLGSGGMFKLSRLPVTRGQSLVLPAAELHPCIIHPLKWRSCAAQGCLPPQLQLLDPNISVTGTPPSPSSSSGLAISLNPALPRSSSRLSAQPDFHWVACVQSFRRVFIQNGPRLSLFPRLRFLVESRSNSDEYWPNDMHRILDVAAALLGRGPARRALVSPPQGCLDFAFSLSSSVGFLSSCCDFCLLT